MTTYHFSLLLVIITFFTGLVWLVDHFLFRPKRVLAVEKIEKQTGQKLTSQAQKQIVPEPSLVEFSKSIFPLIAFILILRSFIYEPFRIPSGSMMPTLLVGDFILVEKFRYGLRDPLFRKQLLATRLPKHGEVVVFKYPEEPDLDYIKRVIGLPGDKVVYRQKKFLIEKACAPECQGEAQIEIPQEYLGEGDYFYGRVPIRTYHETHGEEDYSILINPAASLQLMNFYKQTGLNRGEWVVPEGHYFVIGDNRDNSRDSRFWGFVPEENLVGRAVFIWLSFEFDRAPDSKLPSWIPTKVRFERMGSIE